MFLFLGNNLLLAIYDRFSNVVIRKLLPKKKKKNTHTEDIKQRQNKSLMTTSVVAFLFITIFINEKK